MIDCYNTLKDIIYQYIHYTDTFSLILCASSRIVTRPAGPKLCQYMKKDRDFCLIIATI